MDRTNKDKAILTRVRDAWAQADRAMEKIDTDWRGRIWEIVSGDRKPSSLDLALIADATRRTVGWFLFGEENEEANPLEHPTRCEHEDTWFNRTICPEPCGGMHTYCNDCGKRVGSCLLDNLKAGLQQLRDGLAVPARTLEEEQAAETSHVFVPTGPGTCAVCQLSIHAEVHGGYPQVCVTCGHAKPHRAAGIGVCEFKDCGCDGPVTESDEIRYDAWVKMVQERENAKPVKPVTLCEECTGTVYTFPRSIVALAQRLTDPEDRWASFVYPDHDGDELVISDMVSTRPGEEKIPGVFFETPPSGVFVPLHVLEAVVSAIREAGLRATQRDDS